MKKLCNKCNREIISQGYKAHFENCDGSGILKRERERKGKGQNWLKGKTFIEVYGEEKTKNIKEKTRISSIGKLTGKAKTIEAEEIRKHKIAVAMKGNKNGATAFRRQNIIYKGIHFKSSWEVNTAKFFDDNNIIWKYEDKTYSLSETTSYNPDFSLYENGIFKTHIEVKGYFRKENKEKFEKWKMMYPTIKIELWDKQVLIKKGISLNKAI